MMLKLYWEETVVNNNVKNQVLSNLSKTEGEKAEALLIKEYEKLRPVITESIIYVDILGALELLEVFVFRVPDEASKDIAALIKRVDTLALEVPDELHRGDYYSNASLQVKAIEVLSQLRYLAQELVQDTLLPLCLHDNSIVSKSALGEVEKLAEIQLNVFNQIGVSPQLKLLEKIEALSDDDVKENSESLFLMLHHFLSSNISSHTWNYSEVVIKSGAIPSNNDVKDLRQRTLDILKRIYILNDDIPWKKNILSIFQDAAYLYSKSEISKDTLNLVAENTLEVLSFYKSLIHTENLQIVQKIEHDSYWQYYHAMNDEVASMALEIEQEFIKHEEYQIYRDLIGYEGIFGSWKVIKESDEKMYLLEKERDEKVIGRADSVNEINFKEWSHRILEYIKTDSSDLATFPSFYKFIDQLAQKQPQLMLAFLIENDKELAPVLISIMRGIWLSNSKEELRTVMKSWVEQEKNLYACCKLFISVNEIDEALLSAIFSKSVKLMDEDVLSMVVAVVTNSFEGDGGMILNSYIIPAIKELSKLGSTKWLHEVWFRKNRKTLFDVLNDDAIEVMLENLVSLKDVEYHGEEILCLIAEKNPKRIMTYFGDRLNKEKERENRRDYKAIPYKFHKLGEYLSKDTVSVVEIARSWFDGNYGMFIYKGAKLLENIFPDFSSEFERELIKLVKTKQRDNILFVLAVLRNYKGQVFIHPVCIEIIASLPDEDDLSRDVMVALSSTGVVRGEYGMAEAYERKANEMLPWLELDNKKINKFAARYIENLKQDTESERKRASEEIELRKFQYGVTDT